MAKQYLGMWITRLALAGSATLFLSCGESSTDSPGGDDHIVAGVNLTTLFASPTAEELQAVMADWAMRDVSALSIDTLLTAAVSIGSTPANATVVAHTVAGASHVGAIVTPSGKNAAELPILVYLHGGDDGEDVNDVLSILPFALVEMSDDFVYVIPSFRSETLRINGQKFGSTGMPSPWDYDVDDALALLNTAIQLEPAADSGRIAVVGLSRGACVGMLMAVRDPRIDLVVEFFGPTDFFGEFVQEVVEEALLDTLRELPGLIDLNEQVIQPLKNGALSIAQSRLEMLRRSPVYFADRLPPLQAHHGSLDTTVPVGEAERLLETLTAAGQNPPDYQVYFYPSGGHNPLTLSGSFERTRGFLMRLTNPVFESTGMEARR